MAVIKPHQPRTYRRIQTPAGLNAFRVTVQETDLWISTDTPLPEIAKEQVLTARGQIESYIEQFPEFAATLTPWPRSDVLPPVVRRMVQASRQVGVGPMAAVAGTVAEAVGERLLQHSTQVIVENGGDIFLRTRRPVTIAVMAGRSPLSMQLGVRITPEQMPCGICTSSGSVGHSFSLGSADAVCVLSASCPLADAAATWIGNHIKRAGDLNKAVAQAHQVKGIEGVIVIRDRKIALWGALTVVKIAKKEVEF